MDYHFVSKEKFQAMINEEEFIEFAEVHGNFYGTTKKEIDEKLMNFEIVILEIDTNGAKQVLSNIANCRSIFILPPSYSSLEKRLLARKTDMPFLTSLILLARHSVFGLAMFEGFSWFH